METPKPLLTKALFLCESCREVNIVNPTRRDLYDIFAAAKSGCVLCDIILKFLRQQEPRGRLLASVKCHVSVPKHEITWSLYPQTFSLGIYTTEDDPLAERVLLRPISTDVSSKESFNFISIWLRQCLLHHKECRNRGKNDKRLPSRVIDVQSEGEDPFLVETGQRNGNWVALSYCWGSSPTAITTRRNFQRHCNKIRMSTLPQTIKDAIIITRRVGYRYLWIDSLCIIQDSPEDWVVESLKMADVYGGASLTIAAEAAIDTASGIFESTNVFRQQQSQKFNFSVKGYDPGHPGDHGRLYLRDCVDFQPSTLKSCLKNRAWALQEGLMSRRLISFGKEQLYWRCVTQELIEACPSQPLNSIKLQLSEDYHTAIKLQLLEDYHADFVCRNMKSSKTTLSSWYSIVNDYATRHISVQTDLLVGISAIAKVMAEEMDQHPAAYKAGLWEHDFLEGLLWRRLYSCDRPLIRHAEYIAPSWSWASISASNISTRRIYENVATDDAPFLADANILEIIIENENDDHFGKVSGGHIKLSGPTLEVCCFKVPPSSWDRPKDAAKFHSASIGGDTGHMITPLFYEEIYIREADLINDKCKAFHPKVLLVNISTSSYHRKNSLVLQSTGSLDVYQRVGFLRLYSDHGKFQHPDWTTREITVI